MHADRYTDRNVLANEIFHNNSPNPQREVWIQLACALHRIGHSGTGSGLGMISRAKGVSYGSVCEYTKRVIKALNDFAPKYIFWPDEAERSLLSRENHQQFGFRGCISSTDGTHIVLSQKPGLDGEVFFNRKHSIVIDKSVMCFQAGQVRCTITLSGRTERLLKRRRDSSLPDSSS